MNATAQRALLKERRWMESNRFLDLEDGDGSLSPNVGRFRAKSENHDTLPSQTSFSVLAGKLQMHEIKLIADLNPFKDVRGSFQDKTGRLWRGVIRPPWFGELCAGDPALAVYPYRSDGVEDKKHMDGVTCSYVLVFHQDQPFAGFQFAAELQTSQAA